MALFVFVTENSRDSAEKHGMQEELIRLAERVERTQNIRSLDPFPAGYLVKKQFSGRQGRLIARYVPLGDHGVVVFLAVMMRGDSSYEDQFSRNPEGFGRRFFDNLYTRQSLEKFVSDRTKIDPPADKPVPSEAGYGYLHQVLQRQDDANRGTEKEQELVCETRDWVEKCAQTPFKNWISNLYDGIWSASWHEGVGGELVEVPGKPDWVMLVRYFTHQRILLLAAPILKSDKSSLDEIRTRYGKVLDAEAPELNDVLNVSRRAYPSQILEDGDLWIELEQDTEANMALSPEETRLLESVRHKAGGYPLFINGRAGSGKTTILQYCSPTTYYHLTQGGVEHPPVYFTYSAELLRRSRSMVVRLLECNAKWWKHKKRDVLVRDNASVFDEAFKEFHTYLLSIVPLEQRRSRFSKTRYVTYSRFKQLWEERFSKDPNARSDYGPDISWHVIRSYIKGLSSDDLIDPEEYRQLDRKQISVTQTTYEAVYDKVWARWYKGKCEKEAWWDDQDLARYLIEQDMINAVYPAIFCDESQDFTRIELEVILRMSLFSERKIGREEAALVPFVFAGDQFQTLNPTGFRWDAIKAFFVEKFILALTQHEPKRIDLNYQELTHNYRSSRTIVQFSNFVQALRARLFQLPGIEPQKPWEHELNPAPVTRFRREDDDFWNRLKAESDVAIIVPCGEGEEVAFIRADPVLKTRIKIDENDVPQMLVLSANRAKGLEFARVVLYGFGEQADPNLLDPLQGKPAYADDPDRSLPYQYFINRLYVGVSRPKKRLFIVDSEHGLSHFWSFAHDAEKETAILEGLKQGREVWAGSLARLELGNSSHLALDRAGDPLENATNLERDGRARRDAYMLMQAAVSYRNAGSENDATRCTAEAKRIQGDNIEAGRLFLECGDEKRAVAAYWDAKRQGWKQLVKAAQDNAELIQTFEYKIATALTQHFNSDTAAKLLQEFVERCEIEPVRAEMVSSSAWAFAAQSLVEEIKKLDVPSQEEWGPIAILVSKLHDAGLVIGAGGRALLHYRAGQLGTAVDLWEQVGERSSQEYRLAKAFTTPYPEKLEALQDLGKQADIIVEFGRNPSIALSREQARIVGHAYLQRGSFQDALNLFVKALDGPGLMEILSNNHRLEPGLAIQAVLAAFAVAAITNQLRELLAYVDGALPFLKQPSVEIAAWTLRNKSALDLGLMRVLARADALDQLDWDGRKAKVKLRSFAEFVRARSFQTTSLIFPPNTLLNWGPLSSVQVTERTPCVSTKFFRETAHYQPNYNVRHNGAGLRRRNDRRASLRRTGIRRAPLL